MIIGAVAQLVLALVLVLACGVFVAAEFAFVTVDRSTVERAAASGDKQAKGLLAGLKSLSTQLSGAQVGITLTNLAIGFLADRSIAVLLQSALVGLPPAAAEAIAIAVSLVVLNVLTMVYGELVPKNLSIADPLRFGKLSQGFNRGFTKIMYGPIRLLNNTANAIVRMLGIEPQEELRSVRSPEEIASLVRRSAREGVLDDDTADLVERSILFGTRTASDIMTPRMRMHTVKATDPVSAVIEATRQTGHSRFPVIGEDADEVVGVAHVKHAVAVPVQDRDTRRVSSVARRPVQAPGSLELDPLLTLLRGEGGMQMAVVVDEYGGTDGVVTMEDLVEEIVGEIADEHDRLSNQGYELADGSWSVSGLLRPDEVEGLTGIRVPEGEHYDTIAGLFLSEHGSLPERGAEITIALPRLIDLDGDGAEPIGETQVRLTVQRLDGRRIDRLLIKAEDALHEGADDE
ncbi:hemolysin family protein [Propionibacteriaceae bacterium Y2011]